MAEEINKEVPFFVVVEKPHKGVILEDGKFYPISEVWKEFVKQRDKKYPEMKKTKVEKKE